MSYSSYENSRESGTPVELYEFTQGITRWNYISGADFATIDGQPYLPYPLIRDRIKQNQDVFKNGMSLTFPREDLFASQFLGFPPEEVTTLRIRRGHWGDPASEYIVYWKGRVSGSKASGNNINLECESIFTSIRRPGLRAKFEYGCRHVLYGAGCRVNREAYKLVGVVTGITSGLQVEVSSAGTHPDGYFKGGLCLSSSGVSRMITSHVGSVIVLSRVTPEVFLGSTVSLYPGCDHTKATCIAKFNNLDNLGGFPFIPVRNPFDGSSIM